MEEAKESSREVVERIDEVKQRMFSIVIILSNSQNEEGQGQDRGRSLSVIENCRLDGQVIFVSVT